MVDDFPSLQEPCGASNRLCVVAAVLVAPSCSPSTLVLDSRSCYLVLRVTDGPAVFPHPAFATPVWMPVLTDLGLCAAVTEAVALDAARHLQGRRGQHSEVWVVPPHPGCRHTLSVVVVASSSHCPGCVPDLRVASRGHACFPSEPRVIPLSTNVHFLYAPPCA